MYKSLVEILDSEETEGSKIALQGLKGSSLAYLAADAVKSGGGPFLLITPTPAAAETLHDDIAFYTGSPDRVLLYPAWEILPYENLSPLAEIVSERLGTLYAIMTSCFDVVVAPASSIMHRVIPRKKLGEMVDYIAVGEEVPFDGFVEGLVALGYRRTPQVEERCEFSVRGGIVDIYGPAAKVPFRIEFFGDEVESIREFDLETQRSAGSVRDELLILPAAEACLSVKNGRRIAGKIRLRGREMGLPKGRLDEMLGGLSDGIPFQGIEFFLPDFYKETSTFFEYLPENITVVRVGHEDIEDNISGFEEILNEEYGKAVKNGWPFPPPDELYINADTLRTEIGSRTSILAGGVGVGIPKVYNLTFEDNCDLCITLSGAGKDASPLAPVAKRIKEWRESNISLLLIARTFGQGERLRDLFRPHGLDLKVTKGPPDPGYSGAGLPIYIGDLSLGFRNAEGGLIVITEEEIFGERHRHRGRLRKVSDLQLSSFSQLKQDDYVVHMDHGIGIYRGLKKLQAGGTIGDYLELEYLGGDKVFLPVDRLNLAQRYASGEKDIPRLDKLGSGAWEKVKKRVRKAVTDMARELMEIHAAREVMDGFAYSPGGEEFREFEASFEYEETQDQKAAIEDVITDLENKRPMDRLICGDVGYGKTEVAIRGAFKVAMDGRQVAVLVPTTILAQQHHYTFEDRFKGYPVVVEHLTRFCNQAKKKDVLKRLREGKVDVIIGTHRLLQKDVEFRNLGLVVIDEEQRFGVTHKERLKKMKKTVEVLTLTATPIPRTLNMAMSGIKDLSIISSPPEGRLAIRTSVIRFDETVIREAVLRELRRGGQVFFVHNKVHDIENVAARVRAIVPEARIAIAHGQMAEDQLEKVMLAFYKGNSNLLLCTTIIESGLDIPTANTIIINNAHGMGLAQLYQLRGRVGRSKHRAYAYLVVPGETILTGDARKRLQAIQEMSELSSGFRLASYDLEIRGAGNIVGHEQSGNIEAVGFELFTSMLEKAVAELKGDDLREEIEPEIRFPYPAFIPESYVADTNQRLGLYKRLSSCSDERDIEDMRPELLDRFGPIPVELQNFMELISLKIILKIGMVKEASLTEKSISVVFHERADVDIDKILGLVSRSPVKYSITPEMCLKIIPSSKAISDIVREGKKILKGLVGYDNF